MVEWTQVASESIAYAVLIGIAFLVIYAAVLMGAREKAKLDEQAAKDPARPTIIIDPGHGRDGSTGDPGATDPPNNEEGDALYSEEDQLAFDIASRTSRTLQHLGYQAALTRQKNQFVTLSARAEEANRVQATAFVSIHLNAGPPEASGFEAYCFPGSTPGGALRDKILYTLASQFPTWRNRGGKEARYAVLRLTKMPAVLVECGFITNVEEEKKLHDPEVRQLLAEAIASGVDSWSKGHS